MTWPAPSTRLAPNAPVLAALEVCNGFVVTMWNIVTVTLRQRIVPNDMLGRVNSAYRMIGWGLMPVGAGSVSPRRTKSPRGAPRQSLPPLISIPALCPTRPSKKILADPAFTETQVPHDCPDRPQ